MINSKIEYKPIGKLKTALGELVVFDISAGDQQKAYEGLGKPLAKCDPLDFARAIVHYTCFPADKLNPPDSKSSSPILSADQVRTLSTEDLENFARIYVENNDYLFRKLEFKTITTATGPVQSADYNSILYPRQDKEAFVAYLHRLSGLHNNHQIDMGRERVKSMGGIKFSQSLSQQIQKTAGMGSELARLSASLQAKYAPPEIPRFAPNLPDLNTSLMDATIQNLKLEREARLAPFEELRGKLDQLIAILKQSANSSGKLDAIVDLSTKSVDYMVEENKTQTQIATELKKSGDDTARYSRWNFAINIAVAVISITALLTSLYVIRRDQHAEVAHDRQFTNVVAEIKADLGTLTTAVSALQAAQQTQNLALVDAIQKSTKDNSPQLQQMIQIQERALKQSADSDAKKDQEAQRLAGVLQQLSTVLATRPPDTNQSGSAINTAPPRK